MVTCPHSQDEALSLLAAGALEPDGEARVRAHLEGCAACRAELEALQSVLGQVALPPPSPRELALLAPLPQRAVGAWHRAQLQRASRLRTTGALMVAAAVVLLALGPVVQRHRAPQAPPSAPLEAASPSTEESLALQQWALADPLADELDTADLDGSEAEGSSANLDTEDLLFNPDLGDSP